MDKFPLIIFRAPGADLVHGVKCDTRIVQDEDELDDAVDDGWHLSAIDAGAAVDQARADAAAAAHAAEMQRQAEETEAAAQAIRAPLLAQIEELQSQLKAEQDAHAAAREQLATKQSAGDTDKPSTKKAKA